MKNILRQRITPTFRAVASARVVRAALAFSSIFLALRTEVTMAKGLYLPGEHDPDLRDDDEVDPNHLFIVPPRSRGELFFVDAAVADPDAFWLAAPPSATVVCIPAGVDSWDFMAKESAKFRGLAAIHIVSHGRPGAVVLNGRAYAAADLETRSAALRQLGRSLTKNGDIFLYGCEVGAGSEGRALVNMLATATGADIAASSDLTGSRAQGGNWELEVVTGEVDRTEILTASTLAGYDYVLHTASVSNVAQLKAAIATGSTDGVPDTITITGPITFASAADAITANVTDGQTMTIVGGGFTIDGNYQTRVFNLTAGSVALNNLTITKGLLAGNGGNNATIGSDSRGGAILNAGNLTLNNVTITGNAASGGGGGGGVANGNYGGGGGGGGGLGGVGGGMGGSVAFGGGSYAGVAGGGGTGGRGGGYDATHMGGRGGSSSGGAGGLGGGGYTNGGAGGTANNGSIAIGGGGGGSGWDATGPTGGNAAGGIFNAIGGTITVIGTSVVSNNLGSGGGGGGGGGGGHVFSGGDGGRGIGAIWNAGTLKMTAANFSAMTGNAGGSGSGGLATGGGATGASPSAQNNIYNTGTLDTNYVASPTVISVNSSTANGSYKVGDTVSIQVNFSAAVTVTGTPQLTLETGTTDRIVNYASGSGTSALTFTYTVQAGDTSADLDYQSTTALSLNGGTIKDASTNNAILTLVSPGTANSLGSNKAIVIDGVAPSVAAVNSSTANGTYKVGDTINVQINFNEAIIVTGTPQLTLETGATDEVVNYGSGSGTSTLSFTYTIQAGDTSADLDYQSATALALNGGTIKDAAGNAATITLAAPGTAGSLGANKAIVVDGVIPAVTSVNSSTANGSYKAGDILSMQVNFSEAVTVTGTPQLKLETGAVDQVVNYSSGSGTSALTFTYTVQTGDTTADLDYQSTTALALNGGTIRDAAGNTATLTLAAPGTANSLGNNKAIVIDGVRPTVTSVNSATTNGSYKAGDTISVQVNFSEAVTVTGTPQLTLETGAIDRVVNYASGSGTSTLTFTYTVQAGDTAADLDYQSTTALALNGGTIRDAVGNNATLTLAAPGAASSLGANKAIVIDTAAPSAPSTPDLAAASDTGSSWSDNITYNTTPTFNGTAEANSTVTVFSNFAGTLGTTTADGSGNWTFTSGALVEGGHSISATATDLAGNTSPASASLSITIDTTRPNPPSAPDLAAASDSGSSQTDNVTNVTTPTFNGSAEVASTVALYDTDGTTVLGTTTADGAGKFTITSSVLYQGAHTLTAKATDIAGNVSSASSSLTIFIDTTTPTATIATAAFSADTGTSASDFITKTAAQTISGTTSANLGAGELVEVSLDNGSTWTTATTSVGTNTWSLSGQTLAASNTLKIRVSDIAGNVGSAFSQAYVLDTTAPSVVSVSVPSNGTYVAGQNLNFTVNLSEATTVAGSPSVTVTLDTGGTVSASYLSGSGTSALTFRYVVQAGNSDPTGIAVGGLSLNGGTLEDAAGNSTDLTLNSVGSTTGVLVDAVAPTVSSITSPANGIYAKNANLDFTVTYAKAITVNTSGGTPALAIALTTGGPALATYISGSGTSTLAFRYTVADGQEDTDGLSVSPGITLRGGTLRDSSGNQAVLTTPAFNTTAVLVDGLAPTVSSIVRSTPTTPSTSLGSVKYRVTFSENVTGVDSSDFVLTTTGTAAGTIGAVTPVNGAVYDVAVGSLVRGGTLRLDLKAGATVADTATNALTAAFTGGEVYTLMANTAPSFTPGADVSVAQDAGAQTIAPWATNISAGTSDESNQVLNFTLNVDDPLLFATPPAISPAGTLTFAPATKASGTATVTVILHDDGGVANGGTDSSAPITFKIAVTTYDNVTGDYNGLVSAAPTATPDNARAGVVKVTIGKKGLFTGTLLLAGQRVVLKGNFDKGGVAHFGTSKVPTLLFRRPADTALSLALQVDVSGTTDKVTGTLTDSSTPYAVIDADRALYTASVKAKAPFITTPGQLPGRYTLVFNTENSTLQPSQFPQGDGVATFAVNASGYAHFTGYLADGTSIVCANAISKQNTWPFYAPFAGGKGSISGMVTFHDVPNVSDLESSTLHWFKPASANARYYPDGWPQGLSPTLVGSKFVNPAPALHHSVLAHIDPTSANGNAEVTFSDGGLISTLSHTVNVGPDDMVTTPLPNADRVVFRLRELETLTQSPLFGTYLKPNGWINGSFLDPTTQTKRFFRGVILQKQNLGTGYFLGDHEGGAMTFQPNDH